MTREMKVGTVAQVPCGEGRAFEVCGRRVAVFRTRTGAVFAVEADCPHRRGPLADGLVGGMTVVCPLHERTFDLRTGEGVGHDDRVASYPVRVGDDGAIMLALDEATAA